MTSPLETPLCKTVMMSLSDVSVCDVRLEYLSWEIFMLSVSVMRYVR
jgi:hypothetical protein